MRMRTSVAWTRWISSSTVSTRKRSCHPPRTHPISCSLLTSSLSSLVLFKNRRTRPFVFFFSAILRQLKLFYNTHYSSHSHDTRTKHHHSHFRTASKRRRYARQMYDLFKLRRGVLLWLLSAGGIPGAGRRTGASDCCRCCRMVL